MKLQNKYYHSLLDDLGGGLPDEVLKAAKQYSESFLGLERIVSYPSR